MEKAGIIRELTLQPVFVLWSPVNIKCQPIKYIADFQYRQGEKFIVEDVKGVRTREYMIKSKIFKDKYPEIDFKEVK